MKYFDTHAHITKAYFTDLERESIILSAKKAGVHKILIPATNEIDSKEIVAYANEDILVAAGVHPSDVYEGSSKFLMDMELKVLSAIGEIGLDFYHKDNPPKEIQVSEFKYQLDFALDNNLPVIIHSREADDEMIEVLSDKKYTKLIKVMHSFASDIVQAKKLLALGCYISFSGILTFKNAKEIKEVAKYVPLDKILIETDTPYLTPTPNRGKKNLPEYVVYTGKYLAELKSETEEMVMNTVWDNSIKVFKC